MEKLLELIAQQQKGHEDKPRYMIGEQLKEIAAHEPISAELLEQDLTVQEMSLEAAERELKKYADANHKKETCFCITPNVAERILREFYKLPKRKDEVPAPAQESTKDNRIDLSAYL